MTVDCIVNQQESRLGRIFEVLSFDARLVKVPYHLAQREISFKEVLRVLVSANLAEDSHLHHY